MPASAGSGASDTPDVVKIMVKRLCPPQPSMVLNGGRLSSEEDQNQSSTMRSANARPQRSTIQDPERINGAQSELRVDIDGKQEVIDPEEITYCVCEDVSYGDMVLCELDEKCEHGQWFPLEWVDIPEIPLRLRDMKWYCPGCRKKVHRGENSNGWVGRSLAAGGGSKPGEHEPKQEGRPQTASDSAAGGDIVLAMRERPGL